MAWGSTVPDAMAALATAFAHVATSDVIDAPQVSASGRMSAVLVGWDDEELGMHAVDGENAREGMTADSDRERYSITCKVIVRSGGRDFAAIRPDAFALFGACGGVLAANTTLGGTVMSARIGQWHHVQQAMAKGIEAAIVFAVDIDAFTKC
jgi:hypothetical protein